MRSLLALTALSWAPRRVLSRLDCWGDGVSGNKYRRGSPHFLLAEEPGLPEPGSGEAGKEPEGVAVSSALRENFCRAADVLQLF